MFLFVSPKFQNKDQHNFLLIFNFKYIYIYIIVEMYRDIYVYIYIYTYIYTCINMTIYLRFNRPCVVESPPNDTKA